MKPVLIIALTVLVIILAGTCTLYYLKAESAEISQQLDALEQAVSLKQWPQAKTIGESLSKTWHTTSTIWSMLIDHYEIDSINIYLAELRSYINTEEQNQALSRISSLKVLIEHIPEKESLTLKNIF